MIDESTQFMFNIAADKLQEEENLLPEDAARSVRNRIMLEMHKVPGVKKESLDHLAAVYDAAAEKYTAKFYPGAAW
jgi:hypothetical protein